MQQLIDFIQANPWVWVVLAVGLAVWAGSIWIVIKSAKFRRKWLWALLSCMSFSFTWSVGPSASFTLGLPLGALYILWFWRFGPSPSAEELARDAERRRNPEQRVGSDGKLRLLRAAYAIASVATLAVGWVAVSGRLGALMLSFFRSHSDELSLEASMFDAMRYPQGAMMLVFVGLFVFLFFRPYWWGKLICVWAGVSWLGFSSIIGLMAGFTDTVAYVLVASLAMLLAAGLHQFADPRFSGSYLRAATAAP